MQNSEKEDLRREVRELSEGHVTKKEAMRILIGYGYARSTVSKYWDAFAHKEVIKE